MLSWALKIKCIIFGIGLSFLKGTWETKKLLIYLFFEVWNLTCYELQKCFRGRKEVEAERSRVRDKFFMSFGQCCEDVSWYSTGSTFFFKVFHIHAPKWFIIFTMLLFPIVVPSVPGIFFGLLMLSKLCLFHIFRLLFAYSGSALVQIRIFSGSSFSSLTQSMLLMFLPLWAHADCFKNLFKTMVRVLVLSCVLLILSALKIW